MPCSDTIVAPATAPGKAGVAIVRLCGPHAREALTALTTPAPIPPARMAALRTLKDPSTGATLDRALVLWFEAPHSFTGEDVVEFHVHGGRAVIDALLACLCRTPEIRLAEAGEFTRRAFANDKLDLLEVEALADLIDAETERQRTQAFSQLSGAMSARYTALRTQVIEALARLEAYLDFPDEAIPASTLAQVRVLVETVGDELRSLLADHGSGERIREGFSVVILGPPNVGKSTLLNALALREVAIVSEQAGTTRDMLEVPLNIGGYAVTLIDTAGLREHAEAVEAIGIARARARAAQADVVLWLTETPCPAPHPQALCVNTKADIHPHAPEGAIAISAKTGKGLATLLHAIEERLAATLHPAPVITRARHRTHLQAALVCLERACTPLPLELVCEELRLAGREIGKITGKIAVDDVLDVVFSTFCIGK